VVGTRRAVGAVLAATDVVVARAAVVVEVLVVVVVDVLVGVVDVEVVDSDGADASGLVCSTVVAPPHAVRSTRSRIPPIRLIDLVSTAARGDLSIPLASSSMDDRPIGMFDSGFGGLTVARAVIDLLPAEDLVYFGDTARYPYGPRPLDEVRGFALQVTRLLIDRHDVKMVVVACNTASAAALELLRFEFDVPVVGVIDPGVRSLVRASRNGRVGVIGTVGTIGSGAYQRAVRSTRAPVDLSCAACPGFVEFVERGETSSEQVHVLAERLLAPLVEAGVDALLLGCTHYPFLARTIGDVMGRDVVLVDSADETAFEVRSILEDTGLGRRSAAKGAHRFVSSGDVAWFRALGSRLLGPELDGVEGWEWD
jgi:glutamate racemase